TVRRVVTRLWAELLELDGVPGDRRFFDLGGNSLLVGRLFARLCDRFPDTGLEVADLFANPTVDDQVRLVTTRLAPPVSPLTEPTTPSLAADRAAPVRPSRREVRRALRLGDDR
ncbi:acyl carrier protein, partial [Streptomyces durbertensis]